MMRTLPIMLDACVRPHAPAGRRLLLIASVGLFLACGGKSGDAPADAKSDSAPSGAKANAKDPEAASASHAQVTASTITVNESTFSETVNGSGVVAARVGHLASLSAPAPTRITAVHVSLGERVSKGANLVSFEATSFDAAVTSADATLNAAELAAARAKRLVEAGVSPRKDMEVANSEVAAAKAASINAHRAQQLAKLTSPIDGVITRLSAVLGANADVGQPLVEVTDTRSLDVQLYLSPAAAAKVRVGQTVALREESAEDAPVVADGKVVDVSAVVDSASRGVLVRVALQGAKRTFRLGESLYGQIPTSSHAKAIVIPDDALVPTGEGFRVFVVDSSNVAHARAVEVGGRNGHRVWIRDGLKTGEVVVTAGAYGMDEGATVVTKKTPEP